MIVFCKVSYAAVMKFKFKLDMIMPPGQLTATQSISLKNTSLEEFLCFFVSIAFFRILCVCLQMTVIFAKISGVLTIMELEVGQEIDFQSLAVLLVIHV